MMAPWMLIWPSFATRIFRLTGMRSVVERRSSARVAVPVRQLWHPISAKASVELRRLPRQVDNLVGHSRPD